MGPTNDRKVPARIDTFLVCSVIAYFRGRAIANMEIWGKVRSKVETRIAKHVCFVL